ncbi:hypothetical protein [Novosphingobium gossypii]|uniref:hypothetical protein n=1 Tax=Novosphingobium gossypii TaxID=1604774 RepID=UPI003D1C5FB6
MYQADFAPSTGLLVAATGFFRRKSTPWLDVLFCSHREVATLRIAAPGMTDEALSDAADILVANIEAVQFPKVLQPLANGAVNALISIASVGDTLRRDEANVECELAEAEDYLATALALVETVR